MDECNLSKFLSTHSDISRRHAAEAIKKGEVRVNGEICTNPGTRIHSEDVVYLRHELVRHELEQKVYVMLHKPRGYVCTAEDPHAPKKAIDLLQGHGLPRLFSAGRLDKNSEGLILFSNDGIWVDELTHPSHQITKTYQVSLEHPLFPRDIMRLTKSGIMDDGERLRAAQIVEETKTRYLFVLTEGKNREIRRMIDAIHNRVTRLKRIAVGRLNLGSLPIGTWRSLSQGEVKAALEPSFFQEKTKISPDSENSRNILKKQKLNS